MPMITLVGFMIATALRRTYRRRRPITDDGGPLAHFPALDEAVAHVGIRIREALRRIRRVTLEQQHRAIAGFGERAAQHDAFGLPGELQVLVAKSAAALEVIGGELIDQQVVHRRSSSSESRWQ